MHRCCRQPRSNLGGGGGRVCFFCTTTTRDPVTTTKTTTTGLISARYDLNGASVARPNWHSRTKHFLKPFNSGERSEEKRRDEENEIVCGRRSVDIYFVVPLPLRESIIIKYVVFPFRSLFYCTPVQKKKTWPCAILSAVACVFLSFFLSFNDAAMCMCVCWEGHTDIIQLHCVTRRRKGGKEGKQNRRRTTALRQRPETVTFGRLKKYLPTLISSLLLCCACVYVCLLMQFFSSDILWYIFAVYFWFWTWFVLSFTWWMKMTMTAPSLTSKGYWLFF